MLQTKLYIFLYRPNVGQKFFFKNCYIQFELNVLSNLRRVEYAVVLFVFNCVKFEIDWKHIRVRVTGNFTVF